ncbi:MAG TPA: hypothetical protein ENK52_01305 [Saprospiraceae bacterium]|nr:hypothetical protein [Saprospiraceae bacterium]
MNNHIKVILFFYVTILFGCTSKNKTIPKKEDVLLATVYNRSLYLSEIKEMIPSNASKEDSTLFLNAYVERWVRENLLMHEAELNIPQDSNIDQLVRDYRASLIQHNYEQVLISLELDSTISATELMAFYEKNKNQYKLDGAIVRCRFIKLPLTAPAQSELNQLWKSDKAEDFVKLIDYCNRNATAYLLEDSVWYQLDDIISEIPKSLLSNVSMSSRKDFKLEDENYKYFYKRFDYIPKGEIAPLAFIEKKASSTILQKRKLKLLEKKKEEIYERELKKNNVKIYKK